MGRRACRLIGISRSVAARQPKRMRDHARLRTLAGERRRFGYRRLHELLRREGWRVNHKLVERLYREEKLAIRRRGRQKRTGKSMAGPLRRLLTPAASRTDRPRLLPMVPDRR